MHKILISDKKLQNKKLLYQGDHTDIYLLQNGQVLKQFDRAKLLKAFSNEPKELGLMMAAMVMKSREKIANKTDNAKDIDSIIKPSALVYDKNGFIGFTMPYIKHVDFYKYLDLKENDSNYLIELAGKFAQIEKIMIDGHEKNIVFPDLFTEGNIVLESKSLNPTVLDFDGLQIDNICTGTATTLLGNLESGILASNRYTKSGYFSKDIDKFALLNSFILCSTNINIAVQPLNKDIHYLRFILEFIGLDKDPFFANELFNIYDPWGENNYLKENLLRLSYQYDLVQNSHHEKTKKFIKK